MRRRRLIKATALMAFAMVVLSIILLYIDDRHWLFAWLCCGFGMMWLMGFFYANWNVFMNWVNGKKGD